MHQPTSIVDSLRRFLLCACIIFVGTAFGIGKIAAVASSIPNPLWCKPSTSSLKALIQILVRVDSPENKFKEVKGCWNLEDEDGNSIVVADPVLYYLPSDGADQAVNFVFYLTNDSKNVVYPANANNFFLESKQEPTVSPGTGGIVHILRPQAGWFDGNGSSFDNGTNTLQPGHSVWILFQMQGLTFPTFSPSKFALGYSPDWNNWVLSGEKTPTPPGIRMLVKAF